ncbi:MAG: hypothetical protein AAF466_06105 [Bacteroidota bacterium]
MNLRAYWQFYRSLLPFCVSFGVVAMIAVGLLWGFVFFSSVGWLVGLLGFATFRKDEYYFYYNLGITKQRLAGVSFLINLAIGVPLFLILSLFKFVVLGNP